MKNFNQNCYDCETILDAAKNGHLDCLKYAHVNGWPWDKNVCVMAAKNGHLDCLKYAHVNECPWDRDTCTMAARNGHINCLNYAHENGCPWDCCVYFQCPHCCSSVKQQHKY